MEKHRVIIVDDEVVNLAILGKLLRDTYTVNVYKSGEELLTHIHKIEAPDLVLLDIMMPGLDGYQTLARLKEIEGMKDIPVIFVTSLDKSIDEEKAFTLGAVDYITKPFSPLIVLERIRVHIELKDAKDKLQRENVWLEQEVQRRVKEITMIQDLTTHIITQLVESRDTETGNHIIRTQIYVEKLARLAQSTEQYKDQLSDEKIEMIAQAAPLHDIGKIGIPDAILLKPGRFTPEEYEIMKTHAEIGAKAIDEALEDLKTRYNVDEYDQSKALTYLRLTKNLVQCHHERWDGAGYPNGLSGLDIPLEGRLMAISDVFDALISKRVYKSSWTYDETYTYFKEQANKQFDGSLINLFIDHFDEFKEIAETYKD